MIGPIFGIGTGNMRGYIGDFYPEPSRAKELLEILEESKKEKSAYKTEEVYYKTHCSKCKELERENAKLKAALKVLLEQD